MKKGVKEYKELLACFVGAFLLTLLLRPSSVAEVILIWLCAGGAYCIWRLHNFVVLLGFKLRYLERKAGLPVLWDEYGETTSYYDHLTEFKEKTMNSEYYDDDEDNS